MKIRVWVVFRRFEGKARVIEYYNNLPDTSLAQWVWMTQTSRKYGMAEVRVPLFQYFRHNLGRRIEDMWQEWDVKVLTEGTGTL